MIHFWNQYLPQCFKADQEVLSLLNHIDENIKIGIITNGDTQRQKEKISYSRLNQYFKTVIISDEVGCSKPDSKIFHIALDEMNIKPDETLFIGDDLVKDVEGPQRIGIDAVWFNPKGEPNYTDIKPFAEADCHFNRYFAHFLGAILHYNTFEKRWNTV